MKKIFTLCVVLCLSYLTMGASTPKHEFRATWLATVSGIDWPKTKATNDATREQQKQELIDILDKMKAGNLNAVCFQVRSLCDAMYQSSYEPWSIALTGTRGKDPGYDPLQFAIDEAHKRGMELHVWVNPFRASTSTLAATDMLWDNAGDWLIKYNNSSFSGYLIDPGYPESRAYVVKVLMEIINKYDVDGLVMDDYFYAYGGTTNQDSVAQALHYRASEVIDVNNNGNKIDDWRRSNVDNVIKAMYDSIQVVKPWVRFGMGPGGIWSMDKNAAKTYGLTLPSGIKGSDPYTELYCNTVEWVKQGWVDYVNPQIYWSTQVTAQDYDVLCQWWSKDVCEHFSNLLPNGKKVHHFPSPAAYKVYGDYPGYEDGVEEMKREMDANRANLSSGYTGAVFYNTTSYLQMSEELAESHFTHTTLAPPMEWKVKGDLAAPTNLQLSGTTLSWQHPTAERFTVYAYPKGIGVNTATSNPQYLQAVVYDKSFNTSSLGSLDDITIAVYTYDRYGVEHGVALYNADPNATDDPEPEPEPEPEPSNTITWELNGGEVNTSSIEVPSQSDLMLQFMNNYTSYFGTPTSDIDAFYPSNISGFLYRGFQTRGKFVNEMMLDESAGWKWLADYIVSTSASNPTIVAALNSGTEVNWRYSIAAFFEQNGSGTYNVDFSTAGQPSKWGTAYQIAHGAVLLPTYVTSAFTLPIHTHPEGHDFLGWYDNAEFIGSPLTTISADWTGSLYAKWQEDTPTIDPTWQITYTSTDGNIVTPTQADVFGANIVSNTYENGVGTITFDGPVTSIGECAFLNRNFLYSITIPNRVTSLGDDAFCCCGNLTSIFIPNSVAYIESGVFSSCTSLASIVVEDNNEYYDNRNNCNAIIETKTNTLVAGCKNTIIPNSVTRIGDEAFNGCEFLPFISIPNSVTSIGSYAFYGCSSLTSITIPNSVTSIGKYVFYACRALTSMVIDSDNNHYDSRENCNAIIETATNTLISGCQNTIIPSSVTSIGARAFSLCNSLTSITIPNSVISIWDEAFEECSGLTSITIPNSVTNIGDKAFFYCSNLTSVIIGNSVTSIGNGAFSGCSKLNTIHVEATIPPALEDSTVFMNTPSPTCYIPCGTLAVYEASDWASQVSSFVEDCPPASAAITYVLNGGVQSEWETPQAMYNELNALWNTFSGTSKTWGNLENLKANVANGIPTQAGTMALDFIADENFKENFEWLVTYMDAKCTEQGQTLPSSNASFLRYNLQAFFIDGMRTSWPISADYTICGVSTVEAYQPYWKSGFANPTNPTEEFVLNAPYKEGYTFAGWYTNADFSGEKVTTINSETTGTLYAKWIEYIPTIAEVRALADNTETKVAGVVNFISVTNMYIQDATGGILVSTNDTIDYRVGDRIVVRGVRTIYGGAPKIENAIVVSVEAAALYDVTTFETLKPLMSDSIDHKYFATRVTIPGLKIVSYDAYPIVQDLLGNQVACHMMSINPVQFPIGTKVNVTAVAGWYDGLLFVGDANGIELADGPKKDTYDYPVRAERYTLTNDWIYSNTEGNFAANKPGSDNYVRGMAVKDGIMYFINRENGSLTRVDGATGEILEPLKITGEHLFERIGENGEWESACTLPFNDIKFDQAGNCLIGSCVSGDGTFQIYEVDLETGAATLVVEERLYDNSDFTDNGYRFDAFGVYGDIKSNACVMAADGNGSLDVYRWLITDGKWETADRRTANLSKDDYYWTATSWGTAPQIYPLDDRGTYFYVDGFNTYPMLFNEYGTLLEDFYTPTEFNAYNNEGEILTVNAQLNGLQEFQVGNEYFLIIAAGHTNNGVAPSSFVLYKFADDSRSFSSLEPLWYFPANGMGTSTNGCCTAPITIEVEGNKAHLYLYATNNGYARYTLNVGDNIAEPIDPTWQITYTSTDGNIVTPYKTDVFGANIVSNTYENGVGVITFDGPVTSIGGGAFYSCDSLKSIVIPSSVTSIVTGAFDFCHSLDSLVVKDNVFYDSRENCNAIIETATNTLVVGCRKTIIPNNVTSIGNSAFCGRDSLQSIIIPDNVISIGGNAFSYCTSLYSIVIPNSITCLENATFFRCSSLSSIVLPESITTIKDFAFEGCASLTSIELPSGITELGNHVFAACSTLVSIDIPEQVTIIKAGTFASCPKLTSINIPDNITTIERDAFWGCKSITSIVLPNNLTILGGQAFRHCTSLVSITLPNKLQNIGNYAFANCSSLDAIHLEATTPLVLADSTTFVGTPSPTCYIPCGTLAAYQASEWAQYVSEFVEEGCIDPTWQITYTSSNDSIVTPYATDVFGANIVSNTYENGVGTITFDGPVTSIGRCAFNNCSSLSSIVIPNTVEKIGVCAFYGSSIISLDIPNSVTSLGDWAFADTPIESIAIPNSVTHIGVALLTACNSLTSIVVEEGNSNYDSRDNCNAIIEKSTNRLIATCPNTIIPNTVTTIATRAFQNSAITSIDIPNSVVRIEAYAFRWATQLNSITIPNSVNYIGDSVFYSCPLDTIRMEAMTPPTIGINPLSSLPVCFIPCGSLAAYNTFVWASQVSEFVEEGCAPIQMCGDNLYWEYADGVLTITGTGDMYDYADDKTGPAPWYDVRGSITTINMPNEMTKIGDYAFYKCTEVTSINMPTTLTAIGEKAFAQDTKLACEIILPASMTTIASRAFFNCQAVTAFHIEATTPPTIPNDAFERTTAPIHVPCGYGHIYGKHAQWGVLNLEMCELLQDNVYYYPIDSHTARAVTYHSNPTDTLVIPSAVVIDGMPRTMTEVAASAFADCKDIPAIIFNEGLEYIGERAFVRCYGLQGTIVLPATLETIGERAFSYCNNVDRYTIQAMTPPVLGANAFTGDNKNALFYISCEAMDDYKVATNWSSLKSRLRDACLNIYHYNTALGANGVHTTEDTLVASIYYRRQFTTSRWETLYLPFEVDRVTVLEDGVEYDLNAWSIFTGGHYYLAKPYGIENKEVVFGFTQVVDAHTPYIIQFKEPYYHDKMITFHGKESWNKLSTSFEALPISFEMQMAGNTTLQDQILEEPVYMLRASSNFILQNTTTTLHPFECYVMPYATPSGAPARMNVRFRGDVPTAVESVKGNESRLAYTINDHTLTVYPQGQAFSIYSLNGALIYSCEAGKEAVDCELNSGCYLLHAGTEAHKIML